MNEPRGSVYVCVVVIRRWWSGRSFDCCRHYSPHVTSPRVYYYSRCPSLLFAALHCSLIALPPCSYDCGGPALSSLYGLQSAGRLPTQINTPRLDHTRCRPGGRRLHGLPLSILTEQRRTPTAHYRHHRPLLSLLVVWSW